MNEIITKENIGMEKISPSALDCYEQCPKLFYYQYWLGLKIDEDKLHLDFGTAIHEAIGMIYLQYDDNFKGGWCAASFDRVENKFLEHWRQSHVKESSFENFKKTKAGQESEINTKEDLYEQMKEDGIKILKSYWSEKEKLLVEHGHDLSDFEMYLKVEMHDPDNPEDKLPIPLSMRLDAITRKADKIVDFKTSKGKYDTIESRNKIQGLCYLFGYLMNAGKLIKLFDYIVLRKNLKSDDRIEVVNLQYDEADMKSFYQRVRSILVKIKNREFSSPLTGHSSWCRCREYDKLLDVK